RSRRRWRRRATSPRGSTCGSRRRHRCRTPPAHRAPRPPPAPPPCRPVNGTPRPVPASRSSARGAQSPLRCRRRSPCRRRRAPRRRRRREGGRMGGERGDDGDRHASHAEQVAPPAGLGTRQPTQRENEENAGDEIKQRDDIGGHRLAHFFFWYMPSMRCVTRNPPKMLTEAKVSATKPRTRAQIGPPSLATSATPTASSAPTTITDEIAFVTDISGVCKAGVTDQTT